MVEAAPGFRLRAGQPTDRALLLNFLQQTYREHDPHCPVDHLSQMLDQYWSQKTGTWFVQPDPPGGSEPSDVACLWLGRAIDQLTGDRYTHVFLLYVDPKYRRRGLGAMLMQQAEAWAKQQGDRQIGVQVLVQNEAAQQLYAQLGYHPQALLQLKQIT